MAKNKSGARLYGDLAWIWPYLSPPEEYDEEAAVYVPLIRAAGMSDGSTLLHLGSGGGSLDFHLKQHFRVTGIDLSADMVGIARGVNPEVEYLVGDLRTADLERQFDVVFLHDACAYLTSIDELQAAYATAARHLRPGGLFITLPEELRSHFRQYAVESFTGERDNRSVTTIIVSHDPDPTDTWIETTFIYIIREGGRQTIESDVHRVGLYHLEEVLSALRAAGFSPTVHPFATPSEPLEAGYVVITSTRPDDPSP